MLLPIAVAAAMMPAQAATNTIPTPTQIKRFTTLSRQPTYGQLKRLLGAPNVDVALYEPSDAGSIKVRFRNPVGYAIFEPLNMKAFLAANHKVGHRIILGEGNRAQYIVLNNFAADKGYSDAEAKRVIAAAASILGKPRQRYHVKPYQEGARAGLSGEVAMWRRNGLQYIFTQFQEHGQSGLWITK